MLQLSCCPAPGEETAAAACPARAGWRAAAADWHERRAQGYEGTVAGRQGPGSWAEPVCVCEACWAACQPARTQEPEGVLATPGGSGWDLWVQAPLGLAGGPSPTASKQSNDSRVELWELQSQVPLVGMTAGRPGRGPPGRGHPCQGRSWPAPGQRLSL